MTTEPNTVFMSNVPIEGSPPSPQPTTPPPPTESPQPVNSPQPTEPTVTSMSSRKSYNGILSQYPTGVGIPCVIYVTREDILNNLDKVTNIEHADKLKSFYTDQYYKGIIPITLINKLLDEEITAIEGKDAVPFLYLNSIPFSLYLTACIAYHKSPAMADVNFSNSVEKTKMMYGSSLDSHHTQLQYITKFVTSIIRRYSIIIIILLVIVIIYLYAYYIDHLKIRPRTGIYYVQHM